MLFDHQHWIIKDHICENCSLILFLCFAYLSVDMLHNEETRVCCSGQILPSVATTCMSADQLMLTCSPSAIITLRTKTKEPLGTVHAEAFSHFLTCLQSKQELLRPSLTAACPQSWAVRYVCSATCRSIVSVSAGTGTGPNWVQTCTWCKVCYCFISSLLFLYNESALRSGLCCSEWPTPVRTPLGHIKTRVTVAWCSMPWSLNTEGVGLSPGCKNGCKTIEKSAVPVRLPWQRL